jgi:hypothetical protein
VPAERQGRIDQLLTSVEPQLVKSACFGPGERLVGKVRKCGAAPQGQCLAQDRVPLRGVRRRIGIRDEPLEATCVQVIVL